MAIIHCSSYRHRHQPAQHSLDSTMKLRAAVSFLLALTFVSVVCLVVWSDQGAGDSQRTEIEVNVLYDLKSSPKQSKQTPTTATKSGRFPIPSVILTGATNGIGNQLFKYAFGYALSRQLNASLFINFKRPEKRKFSAGERTFVLDQFKLDESKVTYMRKDEPLPPRRVVHVNEVDYFENRIPNDKVIVLDDFWVSEKFFQPYAKEIMAQYEMKVDFSDTEIYRQISSTESVAVHFRIGDFDGKTAGNNRVLPFSYHVRAMELAQTLISQNLTFFVFSDDIKYVKDKMKKHLPSFEGRVFFVSNSSTNSIQEFYLMRACKHTIVPNSTFSWWAAYLNANPNKVIIAPYPRNRPEFYERYKNSDTKKYKKLLSEKFSYPADWVTLDPFIDEVSS